MIKSYHTRTAKDFKTWMKLNPRASRRRRIMMFNSFADSNYYDYLNKNKEKKVEKAKVKKYIKRV